MAGGGCACVGACASPTNQTVNELDSWTQYGAGRYDTPPLFTICTNKFQISVQINSGGWIDCSSVTQIKLTSGVQAQNQTGQIGGCNAATTPRATWGLQAASGSGGSAYSMRVKVVDAIGLDHWYYFTITVNSAETSQPRRMLLGAGL